MNDDSIYSAQLKSAVLELLQRLRTLKRSKRGWLAVAAYCIIFFFIVPMGGAIPYSVGAAIVCYALLISTLAAIWWVLQAPIVFLAGMTTLFSGMVWLSGLALVMDHEAPHEVGFETMKIANGLFWLSFIYWAITLGEGKQQAERVVYAASFVVPSLKRKNLEGEKSLLRPSALVPDGSNLVRPTAMNTRTEDSLLVRSSSSLSGGE